MAPVDHHICFAVKSNSNLGVLRTLADQGSGFDIVSGGELQRIIDAGGRALIEQGVMTGARKHLDRGLHVAGMALGDDDLLSWLADTPEVVLRDQARMVGEMLTKVKTHPNNDVFRPERVWDADELPKIVEEE